MNGTAIAHRASDQSTPFGRYSANWTYVAPRATKGEHDAPRSRVWCGLRVGDHEEREQHEPAAL